MEKPDPANLNQFQELFDAHGDRIYRFCYRLSGSAADAEDLAQEVFIAAFRGLDKFEGRSTVTTWLYRIALNKWHRISQSRERQNVPLLEDTAATGDFTSDPSRAGLERMSLEQAIMDLPENLREVFMLVKVEGLKYREAAIALGIPQGTVQRRVHDAVIRLRTVLSEPGEEPAIATTVVDTKASRSTKGGEPGCTATV